MSIRFLNCGTIRPYFPKVEGGVTCLLVETNQGPVLVDTGLGIGDLTSPGRLMRFYTAMMRSRRDVNETAYHQVQQLGYQPSGIRHIVMTHLHLDHAGGLPDFPDAKVHLYRPEYEYVISGKTSWEYIPAHWQHGPKWEPRAIQGEKWYDFDAIRLTGFEPEIWLVPLVGHSPGHAGVAVGDGDGWVFHAGDAMPFDMKMDEAPDWLSRLLIGPHVPRIREFIKATPEVHVVGSHMSLAFYQDV